MKSLILLNFLLHLLNTEAKLTKKEARNGDATVKEQYIRDWEGETGLYGDVKKNSLAGYMEADHIPPKSVYASLPNDHRLKGVSENQMPAILVRRTTHRDIPTTGSSKVHKDFRSLQAEDMEHNNFYFAIMANIESYDELGYLDNNRQLKNGLIRLLDEHVALNTITRAERDSIILVNKLRV